MEVQMLDLISDNFTMLLVMHSLLALIFAVFSALVLEKRYENDRYYILLFFFVFNISIPVFGPLFSTLLTYYTYKMKYAKTLKNVKNIDLEEFFLSFPMPTRSFGEGAISELISSQDAPASKKISAMESLSENLTKNNIKLIRHSLKDIDDEVRLFGFSIIDKMEKNINERITFLISEYEKDEKNRGAIAKELAFLYWDLVYYELTDEVLKNFLVKEAEKYAYKAIDFNKDDMELHVFLGKIYLYEKKYSKAKRRFFMAFEYDPERYSFAFPYLAEIFFLERKFSYSKSLMMQDKNLEMNTVLNPIVTLWNFSND